jgi:cell division septation protein DedD
MRYILGLARAHLHAVAQFRKHRPMTTLLSFSRSKRMFRSSLLAVVSVACALVLSGCAVWPKSLTFWGDKDTEPAFTPIVATLPPATSPEAVELTPIVTSTAVAEPASAEVSPMASLPPETKSMAAPATPPKSAGPVKMEKGFYINVGLFAVPSNASNAFQKLDMAGLPAYTELLETNVGKLVRVRVGGFPTKAKADAAAKKIRAMQLDAIVFRHNK